MKSVSNKFARALGISLVVLLGVLLLALFVTVFFAERGERVKVGKYQGARMMEGGMMDAVAPSATITASPMMAEGRGMMGQTVQGNMMETAPLQMMERKVVKSGTLNLQVTSMDETVREAGKVAEALEGSVAYAHVDQMLGGAKTGSLTVKVAVEKFDEAMARLKALAVVVVAEDFFEDDVTAQAIDLQARINNKKAAEVTLQALFERATKISDVIEITDRLAVVRSEIESLEGQRRYLESETSQASITVFLTEDVRVAADQGFRPLQTLRESLVLLIGLFGDITQGLIRALIVGVPVLLIDGAILWILYRVVRKAVVKFWPGSVPEKRRIVRKR